mmetsp:Transcript_11397/g.16246  ORF Transcript_11397/g.16246 Transcript_11397/m.16246 type:complete len:88 (+) Transcript_11397:1-264(+)
MARRYMKSISLDLAAIIEKPGDQEQAEPTACLGLWRVAHLDPDRCPGLPPRVGDATNLEQTLDAVASSSTIGDEIEIKEMSEGIKEE